MSTADFTYSDDLFGWHNDPVAHEETRQSMGMLPMYEAAGPIMGEAVSADVKLYMGWRDALGSYPDYPAQATGDCESFGHGHGNDLTQCIEISVGKEPMGYLETCTEALYGAGREVAHMLGRGQGCYGSAMVKAMTTIGMVPRELVGGYTKARAVGWGQKGIPADIRSAAAAFKLGASALVTTWDELMAAWAAGSVVTVSSNQGFTKNGFTRNAQGICEAGGTWGHCMLICGRISSDGIDTAVIAQSWGPRMPGGPCPFDLPPFCFRARKPVVQRMLGQKDSYALTGAPAFVKKPLPSSWTYGGFMS